MDILVVGATRGTGRAVTDTLLADGHTVTAFGRTATATFAATPPGPGLLRAVDGDALDHDAVAKAVAGQDAVVVTLGISDNPVTVRLLRRATTALDVRSRGTAVVLGAMRDQGVRRVVVQTTYGLGDTWQRLDLRWKATFRLLLWPQLKDSARQEEVVRASGLDWTLVRPVALSGRRRRPRRRSPTPAAPRASRSRAASSPGRWRTSRPTATASGRRWPSARRPEPPGRRDRRRWRFVGLVAVRGFGGGSWARTHEPTPIPRTGG